MKHIPLGLIVLGFIEMVLGFLYDLVFAGLPYQDPTPEMAARWAFHKSIGDGMFFVGVGFFIAGLPALAIRRLVVSRRGG